MARPLTNQAAEFRRKAHPAGDRPILVFNCIGLGYVRTIVGLSLGDILKLRGSIVPDNQTFVLAVSLTFFSSPVYFLSFRYSQTIFFL